MTILDDTIPAKVVSILATYGKSVTLTDAYASTDYDPSTGAVTGTPSSQSVLASPPYPYDARYVNGATILEGDARMVIASTGLTVTITEGMKVVFDSTTWHIVRFTPFYSGDSIAAYELQVRR